MSRYRGPVALVVALVTVVGLLLASCATPEAGGGRAGGTAPVTAASPSRAGGTPVARQAPTFATAIVPSSPSSLVAPDPTRTVAAGRAGPYPTPPPSTLRFGGQVRAGRTSSFTWTTCDTGRCRTVHADAPGITIPSAAETLDVPGGAVLTFAFGGATPPTILAVTAYVLDERSPRLLGPGWLQRWDQRTIELPAQQAGLEVSFTANLPGGEYIIVIDLRVREGPSAEYENTAPYGFRVIVR